MTTRRRDRKKGSGRKEKAGAAARKTAGRPRAPGPERAPGNREKILRTALRLFTQYGVDATPTARISREAGVSTGTLFHYFPDKDRLVTERYRSIKKEMAASAREGDDPSLPTKQRITQCMRRFIAWGVAHPSRVRFLDQCYNYPGIGEDVQEQIHDELSWMAGLIRSAISEDLLPDLPFEFHGTMMYQIISGILALIGSGETGLSAGEITEQGLALLWKR